MTPTFTFLAGFILGAISLYALSEYFMWRERKKFEDE